MTNFPDTIAAIATPQGRGGVGIIRISGKDTELIARAILKALPKPRNATFCQFFDGENNVIDEGIALYFPGPSSYTGENVLELQGHGGPVVMDDLLQRVASLGARIARPGEFTERAFLNNKMDLTQAEAVADLIDASSTQAARSAIRSLQGEFSRRVNVLLENLIQLRMMIEAAIDFPEEEIDFLAEMEVSKKLEALLSEIKNLLNAAKQGAILQQGITVVIVGKPNAGKSSLLNALSERDSAIVTEIAGTTRDTLREYIHIDGMPVHVIDTAGLHDSEDIVEKEGMRRTWLAIEKADIVLLIVDASQQQSQTTDQIHSEILQKIPQKMPMLLIKNKIDLLKIKPSQQKETGMDCINISAKHHEGVDLVKQYLKSFMGYQTTNENTFMARRRHLEAITLAQRHIEQGLDQSNHMAGELVAEELRIAQQALGEITGEFSSDDLLGRIFSSFCIGK